MKLLRMSPSGWRAQLASRSGFTLVEVLMAMVVLGIGIISIIALQANDAARNNDSKRVTEGYVWAMNMIESLMTLPYGDADLAVQGNPATANDGHVAVQGPFTVEWDVVDNSVNILNTKLVHVFVRWRNTGEVATLDFVKAQDVLD